MAGGETDEERLGVGQSSELQPDGSQIVFMSNRNSDDANSGSWMPTAAINGSWPTFRSKLGIRVWVKYAD
ncbi:MAG: hypothetical protein R2854_27335 [Caldilineaceae bacterium]